MLMNMKTRKLVYRDTPVYVCGQVRLCHPLLALKYVSVRVSACGSLCILRQQRPFAARPLRYSSNIAARSPATHLDSFICSSALPTANKKGCLDRICRTQDHKIHLCLCTALRNKRQRDREKTPVWCFGATSISGLRESKMAEKGFPIQTKKVEFQGTAGLPRYPHTDELCEPFP